MAHQEYPRHMHKAGGVYKVVETDGDKAAAIEDGWALQPVIEAEPAAEDAPSETAPAAKKKPGPKPKAAPVE